MTSVRCACMTPREYQKRQVCLSSVLSGNPVGHVSHVDKTILLWKYKAELSRESRVSGVDIVISGKECVE